MRPIEFPDQNNVIHPDGTDPEKKQSVPLFASKDGRIAICWEVTDEEIEAIKDTNRIWMIINALTFPSMALMTEMPILEPADEFPEVIDEAD